MRDCFLLPGIAAAALLGIGCEQIKVEKRPAVSAASQTLPASATNTPSAAKQKPPAGKEEKPLLLLDDDAGANAAAGTLADNSRCQVCHLNLVQEELALTHAKANIGCAKCHGASDAHIADESWASGGNGTAPDIMFPRDKINPACLHCHSKDKINTGLHVDFFAGKGDEKHCTDCHGKHRLPSRKCKWK